MGIIHLGCGRPHWCVTEDGPNLLHVIAERSILGVWVPLYLLVFIVVGALITLSRWSGKANGAMTDNRKGVHRL